MVSRIIVLLTLCLVGSMTLPAAASPHSQIRPRILNSNSITQTLSSMLILNISRASISSGIIDSGAGYAYFGSSASPAQVFKIRLSDFTNVANLTFAPGENSALAAIQDPSGKMAYFGTQSGQIVKVDLTSFTIVSSVDITGFGGISAAAMDPGTGFAYFGTSTGMIIRFRLSDMTVNRTLTLTPSNIIASLAIDAVNGYAYIGASGCGYNIYYNPPNVVVKLRLSDFSIVAQLDPGEDCLSSASIDPANGSVYFSSNNLGGGRVLRISLTDFSIKGILSPEPVGLAGNVALDPARGVGYLLAARLYVAPFRLSDFNQLDTEFLTRQMNTRLGLIDPATGTAYFGGDTYQNPYGQTGAILKVPPVNLPTNDFSLEPSPSHVSFAKGGVGVAYITVKSNNYTGTINLSTYTSAAYTLHPSNHLLQPTLTLTTNGDNSTILALAAPTQDQTPTEYVITVTGSTGTISRSISIEVTITPGIPGSTTHFLPIISPQSLTMNPYANYSSISLTTNTGFNGTVNFTTSITPNLPHAPTFNVNPSSITVNLPAETSTGVSWVYVTSNSTTATGQYLVDVTATSGNETHKAQLCLLIIPRGMLQFCLLSDPNSLILGPGQTRTTLITQYMPHPPFNASMYLGTINMTISIVSGPSTTALQATLNPSTFPLPYVLPGPQQLETTLTVTSSPTAPPGNYVLQISSTNGTITGGVDIPVTITAAPVQGIPGVFPGDWAEYQISTSWSSTPPGLPAIPQIAQYIGSYEATLRIGATVGNETAGLLSTAYLNGTVNIQEISGNTFTGSPTLFPLIVGSSLTFNSTSSRVFAGASRLVTTLNITDSSNGVTATGSWSWDYQTGILLDYQLTVQGTGNLGTISGQVHARMIDTNLWTPTEPYFTLRPTTPFLTALEFTTTSSQISITSTNNFSGSVTLTAQSIPSNPSLSLSINNTLNIEPGQTGNATLTVSCSIPGQFVVLVNATSGSQFHLSQLGITVIQVAPPKLIISAGPDPAKTGESVTLNFTVHSALPVSQMSIDWGDGTITTPDPNSATDSHIYTTAGSSPSRAYVINVTAASAAGKASQTTSETVNDRPPIVAITALWTVTALWPHQAYVGQQVALNLTATDPDGTVSSISINWGDGSTPETDESPTMPAFDSYTKIGTFTITITATDNSGSTGEASTSISIVNAPVAPAATILGIAPVIFYSLTGTIVAAIAAATFLTFRRVKKHSPRLGSRMSHQPPSLDSPF